MLQCGACNRIIMDKTDSGWKLRTRMVLFTPGGAKAICPSCKEEVPVPIAITVDTSELPKSVNM